MTNKLWIVHISEPLTGFSQDLRVKGPIDATSGGQVGDAETLRFQGIWCSVLQMCHLLTPKNIYISYTHNSILSKYLVNRYHNRLHCNAAYHKMANTGTINALVIQGLYSLSGQTSYRKISWSLEAPRLDVIMILSLWNLTGTSAAVKF